MRPFLYERAESAKGAIGAVLADATTAASPLQAPGHYLAGGTTIVDLMKLDVMQPRRLVDLNRLRAQHGDILVSGEGLSLGAFASMAAAAKHEAVRHGFPVIAQSLELAASAQIRNMATLGGNVLQRTRCPYFRDTSWAECNKREPGSGCAALSHFDRTHAVLGTSEACIAAYPSDFAQALIALDAEVELEALRGPRRLPFEKLHLRPGTTPHVETVLKPGDLIVGFYVPARPWARRSRYVKIRDRESYEFALASAAVALDLDGTMVRDVRIALGGLATVPWRATDAEAALRGKPLNEQSAQTAAEVALRSARPGGHNAFKIALGKQTLVRALLETAAMEI